RREVPTYEEAIKGQQELAVEQLRGLIADGGADAYRAIAKDLLQESDATTALAAALKLLTKEPDPTDVKLTGEAPLRVKKHRSGGSGKPYRSGGGRRDDRNRDRRRPGGSFRKDDRNRDRRSGGQGNRSGGQYR
ncbi:DEAD/DEAH box helicase, partial [Flavobacterium sp. IR1]